MKAFFPQKTKTKKKASLRGLCDEGDAYTHTHTHVLSMYQSPTCVYTQTKNSSTVENTICKMDGFASENVTAHSCWIKYYSDLVREPECGVKVFKIARQPNIITGQLCCTITAQCLKPCICTRCQHWTPRTWWRD